MPTELICQLEIEEHPEIPEPASVGFSTIADAYVDLYLHAAIPGPYFPLRFEGPTTEQIVVRWTPLQVAGWGWSHYVDLAWVPHLTILTTGPVERFPVGSRFFLFGRRRG